MVIPINKSFFISFPPPEITLINRNRHPFEKGGRFVNRFIMNHGSHFNKVIEDPQQLES